MAANDETTAAITAAQTFVLLFFISVFNLLSSASNPIILVMSVRSIDSSDESTGAASF